MARKKKIEPEIVIEPVVVKGSHLTVTHYPDGRVDTVWDWDKLAADINQAIEDYESTKTGTSNPNQTTTVASVSTDKAGKVTGRKKKETKNV